MEPNFSVQIEKFAESHFIKSFKKKYKGNWDITLKSLVEMLERIHALLNTTKAEIISDQGDIKFVKVEFRVFGTNESAKTSGNRCIVAVNYEKFEVRVLLVYSKTDICGHNETAQWQQIIRDNYYEFKNMFR